MLIKHVLRVTFARLHKNTDLLFITQAESDFCAGGAGALWPVRSQNSVSAGHGSEKKGAVFGGVGKSLICGGSHQ